MLNSLGRCSVRRTSETVAGDMDPLNSQRELCMSLVAIRLAFASSILLAAVHAFALDGDDARRKSAESKLGLQPKSHWTQRISADDLTDAREVRSSAMRMKDRVASRLRSLQGVEMGAEMILGGERPSDGVSLTYSDRMSPEEEAWIVAAGELRATNCVDLLLNRISDVGNVPLVSHVVRHYPEARPAFYWLCHIGLPACPQAVRRIPLESDALSRVYLVGLLQTVAGSAQARSLLVSLETTCVDEEERQRILEAIQQCDDGPCPPSLQRYHRDRCEKTKTPEQTRNVDK